MNISKLLFALALSFPFLIAAPQAQAQTRAMTTQGQAWQQLHPGVQLVKVEVLTHFDAPYYHKGVDLQSDEVLAIQATQVRDHAQRFVDQYNQDPSHTVSIQLAGIDYLGPLPGSWEDKGKRSGKRFHKFGGIGRCYLLTYPK